MSYDSLSLSRKVNASRRERKREVERRNKNRKACARYIKFSRKREAALNEGKLDSPGFHAYD